MFDVIVIGGANLDVRVKLAGPHVSATSNPGTVTFTPGGVARNIACCVARLEKKVALISAFGSDDAGRRLREATKNLGVNLRMSRSVEAATGTYVALLDQHGELITAASDMDIVRRIDEDFLFAHAEQLEQAKLIIADCNLEEEALLHLAKKYHGKLIVDPVSVAKAPKLIAALAVAPILLATPNALQHAALTAEGTLKAQGLRNLVIHRGADGAFCEDEMGAANIVNPCPVTQVNDVTGAGDAAVAGLAYGWLQGQGLRHAVMCGQAAAALTLASKTPDAELLTRRNLQELVEA
jgi:pseudouridine kinase